MLNLLWCLLLAARSLLNTQRELALENLALRHQIGVLKRTLGNRRPHLNRWDRGLWVVLSRVWTGWQQVLAIVFVLLILAHDRRRILHFNVTSSPSAAWTAQQVVQAFLGDSAPRYLLRDRDCIYGEYFRRRVKNLGIKEVLSAARSPWQNPYVERLIGSIRRECLDHVIVLNEQHLRRILRSYLEYYHRSRCHLSLDGDAPEPRIVQGPELGRVIALPEVGGLHHRYVRKAA